MLFHPKEKIGWWKFEFQGIFPKRQAEIATKMGKMVAAELFSTDELKERLTNPEQMDRIGKNITIKVADYLADEFPEKYPLANLVISQKMKTGIIEEVYRKVGEITPQVIGDYINKLEDQIDVEAIVEEKVKNFSSDRLEKLLMGILSTELRFIEQIGLVIGFIVGLIQMGLMLWQQSGV